MSWLGVVHQTGDELHFIINCPLNIDNREIMFNNIGELCPKFKDLPNEAKFIWLFTNEDISVNNNFIFPILGGARAGCAPLWIRPCTIHINTTYDNNNPLF
jgi:hypothetical protein